MKFITWILVFSFSMQVMATPVRLGLEAAMNEYEYSMVVDWDQKDQKQAEAHTEKLEKALEILTKQGLTQAEIVSYLETRVKNKQKLELLKGSAALSSQNASSPQELVKLLQSNMENMGQQGANWSGTSNIIAIAPLLIIVVLIVHTYLKNTGRRCVEAKRKESCGYESYCSDWDYNYDGTSYCEDYDTEYRCEDIEECLRWEAKPRS